MAADPINGYTMGNFTPTYRTYTSVPVRVCLGCRAVISRYNSGEYCWPCSSSGRIAAATTGIVIRTKADRFREERLAAVLAIAETLPQPFSSAQIAEKVGINSNSAHAYLRQLVRRGSVRTAEKAIPTDRPRAGRDARRPVQMWMVAGE